MLVHKWSRPDRYFFGTCSNLLLPETSATSGCQVCVTPVQPGPPEPAEDISYVSIGTVASASATGITPGLPNTWNEHDIFLLFVESANEPVAAPSGWAATPNSPQGTGTAGGTSATRLSVFWKRATASETAPFLPITTENHLIGCILGLRGCTRVKSPFSVTSGAVEAVSTATGTIPGMTTTKINSWVIIGAAYHQMLNLVPPLRFCGVVNAGLSSISVKTDNTWSNGNGGGLAIATSLKAVPGATGNTTIEWNQSSTPVSGFHGMIMLSMIPAGQ